MKTVTRDQVGHEELALPPRVQEALGELVGSAKEGLLALSVGVGLGVLAELLEEEVVDVSVPRPAGHPRYLPPRQKTDARSEVHAVLTAPRSTSSNFRRDHRSKIVPSGLSAADQLGERRTRRRCFQRLSWWSVPGSNR